MATVGGAAQNNADLSSTPKLGYRVVAQHPHDITAFTEGLEIREGKLFESVGRYGQSVIYMKGLRSGAVERAQRLPDTFFGEGLTLIGDLLLVLTWREQVGLVFDRSSFQLLGRFGLKREGWGMTHMSTPQGERVLMSDGSSSLFEFDAKTMEATRTLAVRDRSQAVEQLNELEYARGDIYANIWHKDILAVIRPADGTVRAWVDLKDLRKRFSKPPQWDADEHVLNGIAYDTESGHFFVTGKCWPVLFELDIPS